MSIVAKCSCGKSFQAKTELAGKRVRCPACGGVILVAAPQSVPASDDPLGLGNAGFGEMPMSSGNMLPAAQAGFPAQGGFGSPGFPGAQPAPKSGINPLIWVAVGVGGFVLLLFVGLLVGVVMLFSNSRNEVANAAAPAADQVDQSSPSPTNSNPTTRPANSPTSNPATPGSNPTKSTQPKPSPTNNTPTVSWNVTVDPPPNAVAWPEQPDLKIPVPEDSYFLFYPATPSPFVVVGLNYSGKPSVQVWDLVNNQKAGEISDPIKGSRDCTLSPDGKHLAVKLGGSQHYSKIQLWSFESGGLASEIECDESKARLSWMEFASANRLVTHSYGSTPKGYRRVFRVLEIPSGKMLQEIPVKENYQRGKLAISPGGRYLSVLSGSDKLSVYDLQNGKLVGYQLITQLVGESLGAYNGMSFSPDGKQLGFVYMDTNTHVVFLDVATGKIADKLTLAGKPPTASAYTGARIEWLGDRGWCLFGGTVVDRKTRRAVWNLKLPIITRLTARRSLPGGWIVQAGSSRRYNLRFVPLDWSKIESSVAAAKQTSPAHLRPGMSVSLDIQIGKLRAGTPEDTKKRLAEIFTKRFQADEITVADGQPIVLKVAYSESAGRTLQERKGIVGQPTGRTVQATKVDIKMTLVKSDSGQTFFTDEIEHNPYGVTVRGKELNKATVRDGIFRQLLFTLSTTPIPYFVPTDEALTNLPGVTEVP